MAEINTDWLYSEKLAFKFGAGQPPTTFAEEQDRDRSIFLRARPDIVQRLRKAYEDAGREIPAWLSDYPSLPQEKILLPTAPTTEPSPVVPQEDVTGRPAMEGMALPSPEAPKGGGPQEAPIVDATPPSIGTVDVTPPSIGDPAVSGRLAPQLGDPAAKEKDVVVDTETKQPFEEIKRGSPKSIVVPLQEALIDLGYDLGRYKADGDFGRTTEGAVKAFQDDFGLPATGVVDFATSEAIKKAPTTLGQQQDPRGEANEYTKGYSSQIPSIEVSKVDPSVTTRYVKEKSYGKRRVEDIEGVVLHYTHSGSTLDVDKYSKIPGKYGAPFFIDKDGVVHQVAPITEIIRHTSSGTHNGKRYSNTNSVGIEIEVGWDYKNNKPNDDANEAQMKAAVELSNQILAEVNKKKGSTFSIADSVVAHPEIATKQESEAKAAIEFLRAYRVSGPRFIAGTDTKPPAK